MAAAAPTAANGGSDAEKGPNADDHSPSRFTAVNGKEPPISGLAPPVRDSHVPSVKQDQRREDFETWRRGGHNTPSQPDARLHGNDDDDQVDQGDRQAQRSPSRDEFSGISRGKRKRSDSGGHREIEKPPYEGLGVSETPVPRFDDNVESRVLPANPSAAAISHGGHQAEHPSASVHPRNLPTDAPWQEHNSQYASLAQHSQQIEPSDAHIADVLQRGAQGEDQNGLGAASRVTDGSVHTNEPIPSSTYPRERSQGAVQVSRQRKRVFSNRTKTGCLTCRKRKKKCDERHPECNNCLRGGFDCEGYSARTSLQRPQNTRVSVPLQSKEGYSEVGGQYVHDLAQQHGGQRVSERPEMGKIKSIIADDGGHAASQYGASPTEAGPSHGPWLKRNWAGSGHPSYLSEYVERSSPREGTLIHEVSRGGQPNAEYPVVAPLREPPYVSHPKSGAPVLQGGIDSRVAPANNMDSNSPQAQARMALNIEHQLSAGAVSNGEAEKDRMIRGELYQPFDIHLVEERARCKAALWRFNNACNGISGVSTKEQSRLLKEVLVPPSNSATSSPSGVASPRSGGSIGQGAIVMAPFECHYGYNIHIGEDVMISESCRFLDDCPISIGAHTWIGPAVTILGSMAHTNMQERKGSQSRYQGRPVTIEEDGYIGANCTIYPGVRIRRGAYVAPGEVVKSDIVAYGFQGFKPSYM